jgi:N4-gp56 family major capsid protein
MPGQSYSTYTGRINKFAGRVLAKVIPEEKLTKLGSQEEMPQNKSETIIWERFLPYGGVDNEWISAGGDTTFINKHLVVDGVTPSADSLAVTTVSATLQQIACLYSYTDKTRYVHEDGTMIPPEMEDQASTRIVLCREMMVYGALKGTTNKFYGGTGNSISTVNGPPTEALFEKVNRAIRAKHGTWVTKELKSTSNFGSRPVGASFRCYTHTDMEAMFNSMTGFTKVADYGGRDLIDSEEIGSIGGRFRIIVSPLLTYYPGGGAVVGAAVAGYTPKADDSTNIDVYPIIVLGQGSKGGDPFGQVALRGLNSIKANHIPVGTPSAADPGGQRGYVWASTWQAQAVLNDAWMAVIFVGANAL